MDYKETLFTPKNPQDPDSPLIFSVDNLKLEVIDVSQKEGLEVLIALFDPKEPEIRNFGTQALVGLIGEYAEKAEINSLLVLSPPSDKSGPMIANAVTELDAQAEMTVVLFDSFVRSKDKDTIVDQVGHDGIVVSYTTIKNGEMYLGISTDNANKLKELVDKEKQLVIADDVVSTGGTIKGLVELLSQIGIDTDDVVVTAVALEVPAEQFEDTQLPEAIQNIKVLYKIVLPVVVNELS